VVIVAHPDDETLWAGGTLLSHPEWNCHVITLCRASDSDRAPRFFKALEQLGATGTMGDLDDSPDQIPLKCEDVEQGILALLPEESYDLIFTHGSNGEYTRHIRHEETSRSVMALWEAGKIRAPSLWTFAYEDGGGRYPPTPLMTADHVMQLSADTYRRKRRIITEIYGFGKESFELSAVSQEEAFNSLQVQEGTSKRSV
jgi:LmbE family N-acetylglucosaminyl deacetylase